MATLTDTIIPITPTFGALLPVMLDARANIGRKLGARACDGFEDAWCSVHDTGYDILLDGSERCDFWSLPAGGRAAWRAGLEADLDSLNKELRKMATIADKAGPVVNFMRETIKTYEAGDISSDQANAAIVERLATAFGVER